MPVSIADEGRRGLLPAGWLLRFDDGFTDPKGSRKLYSICHRRAKRRRRYLGDSDELGSGGVRASKVLTK